MALAAAFGLAATCGRPQPVTAPRIVPVATPPPPVEVVPPPAPDEPLPPPAQPAGPPALPVGTDLLLRVGLLSDQASASFPCCGTELRAVWGDQLFAAAPSLRVEPAAEGAQPGVYRLQVAALRDPSQADALARKLGGAMHQPANSVLEAASGYYRVRVGRYATREAAEAGRREVLRHGASQAWVVEEGGGVRDPALRIVQGQVKQAVRGRWVAIDNPGGNGIAVSGKRYRGRILLYLNDRGTLNVINELPIEDYLRGVVPSELGPAEYPELEALKAQAVAARTYTVANLGEFRSEGYDICATPRCQVYNGMEVEHPRSDRAIAETAGQVALWDGRPIDALYSSTCGGHTENVEVIFPLKRDEPYLRGVPCLEGGVAQVVSGSPRALFPTAITAELVSAFDGEGTSSPDAYRRRLLALASLAGLPAPAGGTPALQALDARSVRRFVAGVFDLALDARLFVAAEDLPYLVQSPPADWSDEDRRLAALFVKAGLGVANPGSSEAGTAAPGELDAQAREELIYRLALYLRVLRREGVSYLSRDGAALRVRASDGDRVVVLPGRLLTFRQLGDDVRGAELSLVPGDKLDLVWQGDRLLAVVQQVHPQGVGYDRTSNWASWTRFRSDKDLAGLVRQRYPGFQYKGFEIGTRGVSGRVGKLHLLSSDGKSEQVEGLAVRWTLDLPDTLFTAKRLDPPRGEHGWLFSGRGWGHGVGLCQVGAYGMAVRGHDYRQILGHYYFGVTLGGIPASAAAASVAGTTVALPAGTTVAAR